jgi:cytochrome P450
LTTLGRRPEWFDRLRAELEAPAANGAPTLVERITMETLRLAQAEYLYRRLRKDVVFEGFTLPRGWLVRICVGESHRSAAAFDDPERFDPDRFLRGDFPRSIYSPFGGDRHACNGVPLTNVVCRALLEQLTRRYEWAVEGREALDRDFRHWSHWRPSSDLRLRLDPIRHPASAASATGPGREAAATA